MEEYPVCPACGMGNTYFDGSMYVCPDCGYEWTIDENDDVAISNVPFDSNGTELVDGDAVTVI